MDKTRIERSRSSVKKLMVCGLPGTGKSTFFRLLDGHPKILGSQLNEKFIDIFTYGAVDIEDYAQSTKLNPRVGGKWIINLMWKGQAIKISLFYFRQLLARYTYYYLIENEASSKGTYDSFSSKENSSLSFNFDFHQFESFWKSELCDGTVRTPENVVDILYQSFFRAWEDYPVSYGSDKYLAFCAQTNQQLFDFVFKQGFNIKVIFIDRSIEGALATHYLRFKLAQRVVGEQYEINKLNIFNAVKQRCEERANIYHLAKLYPNQFLILDFNEFILSNKTAMDKVSDFLALGNHDLIYQPTHLAQPLKGEYLGKINDRPEDVWSNDEIGIIRYLEGKETVYSLFSKYGFKVFHVIWQLKKRQWLNGSINAIKKSLRKIKQSIQR